MPTIDDVAKQAGVSKATVSYVLNRRETSVRITEATQERVHAAVRALNYRPNAHARALNHKQTETIAVVTQYARVFQGWSGFTNEMMRGVSEAAFVAGYDLILHTKEQDCIDDEYASLTDGRADGALLLRDVDDLLAERLTAAEFPCVVMFARSASLEVPVASCDDNLGGELAARHLLELGHRRILHISGPDHSAAAVDRRAGFERTLRENGMDPGHQDSIQITHPDADATALVNRLRAQDRPTAVFAWSDDIAIHAMSLARRLGLRVPTDLSMIGFDSTDYCNHTDPPLTSVRQPIREIATTAVDMLVRRIRQEPLPDKRRLLSPVLEVRASSAPIV